MTTDRPQRELSLVPFPSDGGEIVLRHGSAVVRYNHESHAISLENREQTVCPTCRRPFEQEDQDEYWPEDFMSPDYFNYLQRSHAASITSSRSASPSRLLKSQDSTPARLRPAVDDTDREVAGETPSNIPSDAFSQGYFDKHFVTVRELGRGGNGVVLLVKHVISGHQMGELALKRIPVGDDLTWLEKVLKEVQLLSKLRHKNLVSYNHVWLDYFKPTHFTPSVPHVWILQQYCNRGDLQSYIFNPDDDENPGHTLKRSMKRRIFRHSHAGEKAATRQLHPEQAVDFFRDIAEGLHYLHENHYIHRDLKPSNCLLHQQPGGKLTCLLSDFGETIGDAVTRRSTGGTGTVSYCAPEVLRHDPLTGKLTNFTQKSDIFSLGLILYLMCFGRLPYTNANPFDETREDVDKLREEIANWAGISEENSSHSYLAEQLSGSLGRLLSLNPTDRPTSAGVLSGLEAYLGRGRSSAGSEQDARIHTAGEHKTNSGRRPPPIRKNRSFRGENSSEYKPPAVETEEPRSPTMSPTEARRMSLPSPKKADSTLAHQHGFQERPPFASPNRQRLILPAPPSLSRRVTAGLLQSEWVAVAIRLIVFGVKLWTLLTPCGSRAVEPLIGYPLLVMATIDMIGTYSGPWFSLTLASLHVAVLFLVKKVGLLCHGIDLHW